MADVFTIDDLNALAALTAADEFPVWDSEESGEPTKKITAQNMTASVKTLGSLVNTSEMNNALAGKQNTLTFDTTPTTGSTNPVTSGGVADAIAQSTADVVSRLETRTVTGTISGVAAGGGNSIDLTFPAISGKYVRMVALSLPGGFNLTPAWIQSWNNSGIVVRAYNARTSATDIQVSVTALYW